MNSIFDFSEERLCYLAYYYIINRMMKGIWKSLDINLTDDFNIDITKIYNNHEAYSVTSKTIPNPDFPFRYYQFRVEIFIIADKVIISGTEIEYDFETMSVINIISGELVEVYDIKIEDDRCNLYADHGGGYSKWYEFLNSQSETN